MPTEPKTALEALESWKESVKYIDDPESGETEESLYSAADLVIRLADSEGISLEQLVPEEEIRQNLQSDAKCLHELLEEIDRAYD